MESSSCRRSYPSAQRYALRLRTPVQPHLMHRPPGTDSSLGKFRPRIAGFPGPPPSSSSSQLPHQVGLEHALSTVAIPPPNHWLHFFERDAMEHFPSPLPTPKPMQSSSSALPPKTLQVFPTALSRISQLTARTRRAAADPKWFSAFAWPLSSPALPTQATGPSAQNNAALRCRGSGCPTLQTSTRNMSKDRRPRLLPHTSSPTYS